MITGLFCDGRVCKCSAEFFADTVVGRGRRRDRVLADPVLYECDRRIYPQAAALQQYADDKGIKSDAADPLCPAETFRQKEMIVESRR